jgi:hypothetical protein
MVRQTKFGVKIGQFGRNFIGPVIRASVFLAASAALASGTFGQDTAPAAQGDAAPASRLDEIRTILHRLDAELNLCATIKAEPVPGQPLAGYKACIGTNGFNHGGNIGKITLANDGLPGTISPDGNKATVGFGAATPGGGYVGGIEYNPATGAVKVSGGPAWGFDAPGSPLKAEISGELGVTYTPPGTRPYGGAAYTQADLQRGQAALQNARDLQRFQSMTLEQKVDELTNMINQSIATSQPRPSQYPQSAPWSAQVLDTAQMAAQMNGSAPSPPAPRPPADSSLPPVGAGAYNPPSLTNNGAASNGGTARLVFDDNAPKASGSDNGRAGDFRSASAPGQATPTRFSYDPNAQSTAASGPMNQPSQASASVGAPNATSTANGSSGMTPDQFRASVNQAMQQFRQADAQIQQTLTQPSPSGSAMGAAAGVFAGQQPDQQPVGAGNPPSYSAPAGRLPLYAPRNGYDAWGNRADSPRMQYDVQGYRRDGSRSPYDSQGYRTDSLPGYGSPNSPPQSSTNLQPPSSPSSAGTGAAVGAFTGAMSGQRLVFDDNAPRNTSSSRAGAQYAPGGGTNGSTSMGPAAQSQPVPSPVVPGVSPRSLGTQSQTAALQFPGE